MRVPIEISRNPLPYCLDISIQLIYSVATMLFGPLSGRPVFCQLFPPSMETYTCCGPGLRGFGGDSAVVTTATKRASSGAKATDQTRNAVPEAAAVRLLLISVKLYPPFRERKRVRFSVSTQYITPLPRAMELISLPLRITLSGPSVGVLTTDHVRVLPAELSALATGQKEHISKMLSTSSSRITNIR